MITKCHQHVLHVINPSIHFSPKGSKAKIRGMAVALKQFIQLLDRNDIDHPDESTIRKELRARNDVITSGKQYFLKQGSKLSFISRHGNNASDVYCVSSICIPVASIPQEVAIFFNCKLKDVHSLLRASLFYFTATKEAGSVQQGLFIIIAE